MVLATSIVRCAFSGVVQRHRSRRLVYLAGERASFPASRMTARPVIQMHFRRQVLHPSHCGIFREQLHSRGHVSRWPPLPSPRISIAAPKLRVCHPCTWDAWRASPEAACSGMHLPVLLCGFVAQSGFSLRDFFFFLPIAALRSEISLLAFCLEGIFLCRRCESF